MWILLLTALVVVYILRLVVPILWTYTRNVRILRCIPGPPALPIIGHALTVYYDPYLFHEQLLRWSTQYANSPFFLLWLGPTPALMAHRTDALEAIMSSQVILDKSYFYDYLNPWMGTGLLTAPGEKWKGLRKLLSPAFHTEILKDALLDINRQARILTSKFAEESETGKPVEVFRRLTYCTLDVICATAMGTEMNCQEEAHMSEYANATVRLSNSLMSRVKNPLLHIDLVFKLSKYGRQYPGDLKIIQDFTTKVLVEKKKEFARHKAMEGDVPAKKRLAFLDMLLNLQDKDSSFTDDLLREEVETFIFAGHDTTAAATSWILYLLGRHVGVQTRVQEEVSQVIGPNPRDITHADVNKLEYLDMVFKEATRLYPPVPYFSRGVHEDSDLCGVRIPKGSTIFMLVSGVHRNPKYWPEPEQFRPERFKPGADVNRHKYAFCPFSQGPRNCVGQKFAQLESKVLLCWILQHFNLESVQDESEVYPAPEMVLRPANGLQIKFTPRRDTHGLTHK